MSIDVSVVVPVYNTERYLPQCIESLINQTLKNVEFIFVDDGSTDHSVEIIEEYRRKDDRIQLIRQQNQYAGVARNNGMKHAKGKYIIFLDSDDFFDKNMLRDAYHCAEKNQTEIVLFNYRTYSDTSKSYTNKLTTKQHFPKGVFSGEDLGENLYTLCNAAPWNKLFLRAFVDSHHLQFQPLKKCNDTYFVYMALALAERMIHINKCYINYRVGNQSSLQGARNSERRTFIDCGMSLKKGLVEAGKYKGGIKSSAVFLAQRLVGLGILPPYTKEALADYYYYAKEHVVPDLFDSPEAFQNCDTVRNVYESEGFDDFLCRQLQTEKTDKETNYVVASSWEARVGRALLALPKKILRRIE